MGLRIGIIGLANVGKSTLFNALLGRQAALTAPYPFATVEPNIGVVDVPDERLVKLREAMFPAERRKVSSNQLKSAKIGLQKKSDKSDSGLSDLSIIRSGPTPSEGAGQADRAETPTFPRVPIVPATVTFVDIAGLVKGAAEGQGLGNQFLAHIRDVDLILHVLRDFDEGIPRAADSKDPEHDAEIVRTELELKDLEVREKNPQYGDYLSKKPVIYAINIDEKKLGEAPAVRSLSSEASGLAPESVATAGFGRASRFLLRKNLGPSEKPVIYAVNVGEDKISDFGDRISDSRIVGSATSDSPTSDIRHPISGSVFYFSAKLEEEISKMPKNEQKEYLKIYGLERSCLDRIISECFRALGLISFFTAGVKEVRAWSVRRDSPAPKAAGVIHSDFEKLFIRAEVMGWEKLAQAGSWQKAKEKGLVKTEGRDYLIKDGDVVNFLIGK